MGIFSRKNKETVETVEEETAPVELEGEPGVDRDWEREHDGPFDITERDNLSGRVDFGAIHVPAVPGMEMRMDVDQKSNTIVGVTCTIQGSKVHLQAYAAPRSEGLWHEIRKGVAEGVTSNGGQSRIDPNGVFGKELVTAIPTQDANGRAVVVTNRVIGIDGPRWLLRAVINGPAASDPARAAVVRKFLRAVVVDRGTDPRPPREVLSLTAPKALLEQAAARRKAAEEAAAGAAAPAGAGAAAPSAPSTAPADTPSAASSAPDTAVPGAAAPGDSAPDTTAPDAATPDNSVPDAAAPDTAEG